MSLPQSILVPLDLGDHTTQLLDYAVTLARKLDAKVHVVHAVDWPLLGAELPAAVSDEAMAEIVARHRRDLEQRVAAYTGKASLGSVELRVGDPRSVIADAAETLHADLIIMGTHGRRGVSRVLLGSVAEQVARTARCPVLLARLATTPAP